MKKTLPAMILIAALWVWMLLGIPTYTDIMLIGSIMFVILLPIVEWFLWKKGKKQDALMPVSAEIFEDPRRRKRNRLFGLTTFSLEFSDGTHTCQTVRDGSKRYQELMALRKK